MASEPLGDRGEKLYSSLLAMKQFNPAELVLVLEACRLADRLEDFNGIIQGNGVINLMHLRHMIGDTAITMKVDAVFAEARQSQLALQKILDSLKLESGAGAEVEKDLGDDLAAQRASRIAKASGS